MLGIFVFVARERQGIYTLCNFNELKDFFDEKIFMSPFLYLRLFDFVVVFYGYCLLWISRNVLKVTVEGELIENITHIGYVLLIGMLLVVCDDYKDRIRTWVFFCFGNLCSVA